jgi:hypothetical protein
MAADQDPPLPRSSSLLPLHLICPGLLPLLLLLRRHQWIKSQIELSEQITVKNFDPLFLL